MRVLIWKCASCDDGVHFCNISILKSVPNPSFFNSFDFEMLFAPQRRALFQHSTGKIAPGVKRFLAFWLRHLLRAARACNLSSLISPDGSAPAALRSLLFDPWNHKTLEQHSVSQLFYLVARLDFFSFAFFFSDLLSSSVLLPDCSPHCCRICPYWWKLDF